MDIEQAIFTSAETDLAAGYQIVAHTDGVCPADLRALSAWGPSHDSLLDAAPAAFSVNFHGLPSGAFCISRTAAAGAEYSGRAGPKVFTQCLVVAPETLLRFGNNPFSLLAAATAQGAVLDPDSGVARLQPFRLAGRASVVDAEALARLARTSSAAAVAAVIDRLILTETTAAVVDAPRDRFVVGLLQCFPAACRADLSFSTGLRLSERRPFRLATLCEEEAVRARGRRDAGLVDATVTDEAEPTFSTAWARFIYESLQNNQAAWLAEQLRVDRPGLHFDDLAALAEDLRPTPTARRPSGCAGGEDPDGNRETPRRESPRRGEPTGDRRTDAAHSRSTRSQGDSVTAAIAGEDPSQALGWQRPEVLERLELLDDTVFEAIAGKQEAMVRLRTLWPETLAALGPELIEESRAQYMQHAMRVWHECTDEDGTRNPELAVTAAEVVALLMDG